MNSISTSGAEVPNIMQIYQPTGNDAKLQSAQIIDGKFIMSSAQTHSQAMPTLQTQTLQMMQNTEMNQEMQYTSLILLPSTPEFNQQLLSEGQQFYGLVITKDDHDGLAVKEVEKQAETKPEDTTEGDSLAPTRKKRSQKPNPNMWACNVRKIKHQSGEAYVNRRGKYVPERAVRNIKNCLTSCKYKCSELINDTDRELIFKAFYSLSVNEKKHFLLNTTERNPTMSYINTKRRYAFKYFFLVRATRYTVCKNFYLGTLAISQKPVYNVHLGKSEMNIPKADGRGHSQNSTHGHALPSEVKDSVRIHIMSFKTVDSNSIKQFSKNKQYLDPSLTIKQMYLMYTSECSKNNLDPVKESMYRRIFRKEFNLHFKKIKMPLCHKCESPVK